MNSLFAGIIGGLSSIFSFLPSGLQLTLISAVAGVVFLVIYGKVSNQKRLKNVKREIYGNLLEAVLFRNDLRTSLSAQIGMFVGGVKYFLIAVPPILVLAIPCVLIMAQLNSLYGYASINPNESVIVRAKTANPRQVFDLSLTASGDVRTSPPLRILSSGEVLWRVDAKAQKSASLLIKLKENGSTTADSESSESQIEQKLAVGETTGRIVGASYSDPWWRLLYPDVSLKKFGDKVSYFEIQYPAKYYSAFGISWNWLIIFLLVSILTGLVASKFLRIEI